jgi:hypothetical protein
MHPGAAGSARELDCASRNAVASPAGTGLSDVVRCDSFGGPRCNRRSCLETAEQWGTHLGVVFGSV